MTSSTEYTINETLISGLLEIDVSLVEDSRGWFQEKFQKAKLVELGLPSDFVPVQHNISYNKEAGVTRGIHAEPWDKYISVVKGKIFGVYVDLRPGPNFSKVVYITVDPNKAVFVPKGIANAFQTLEDDTYYTYLVNAHWSAEGKYSNINLADPRLNIQWPIPLDQAIISDKDRNHPML
jgi:dTDP-4-dehydrorhamnose 3,5-epimerase